MNKQFFFLVGNEAIPTVKYASSEKLKAIFHSKVDDNHVYKVDDEEIINLNNIVKNNIIFRYGCRAGKLDGLNALVYNQASSIKKASNKKIAREILESNNISVPRMVTPDSVGITFPIIGRPPVHTKGQNFFVYNTLQEFKAAYNPEYYYSVFIDKVKELRFHVGHSSIIVAMNKQLFQGEFAQGNLPGQSFTNIKWNSIDVDYAKLAIKACNALSLDFGAVDMIIDKFGNAYVLEVNTAPDFDYSDYFSQCHDDYWNWLADSNTRRQHFNLLDKETSKELIFKNNV